MSDPAIDEERAAKAARAKALLQKRQKKKAGTTAGSPSTPVLSSLRHSTVASPSQDGSSYAPSEIADDNRSEASVSITPNAPPASKSPTSGLSQDVTREAPVPQSLAPIGASHHADASSLFAPNQPTSGFRSASSLFGGDDGPSFNPSPSPGEIALSRSELERARAELEDVRAQLRDAENQVATGKAAIKAAEQASRRAKEEAVVAEETTKRTSEELRKANAAMEDMREDQRAAREDATAAYEAMRATETAKRQAEEEVGNLKIQLEKTKEDAQSERNSSLREIEQLKSELEGALSLSSQRQSTITLLVEEKSNLGAQLAYFEGLEARSQETDRQLEENRTLVDKLNARVAELESSLRTAVSASEELANKEREASDRVRELERLSSQSSRTISDLQAELKEQRARVRELEEQIEADDRVEVLERRLKSMQDRSEELEEKFNKSKQSSSKLKAERDALESKCSSTDDALREAQEKLTKLQTEYDQSNAQHLALKTTHDSLVAAQTHLNARLVELEQQLERSARESQDTDAAHNNTKQQLNEALALVARGASTESTLATLQAENEGLLANLAEMRPKIVELTEAKLTLGETIDSRDKSIRDYEAHIKTLESELADAHSQKDDSGTQIAEAKAHASSLEKQLEHEKVAISEAYAAYEELQSRLALVEQQFRESESSRDELRSRAEQSEARANRLDGDLERRAREVTTLLEEIEARTRETTELRSFLEKSRTDLDAASSEITAREDELSRLRLNGTKSPTHDHTTLANETMELELSTMRSRIRTLEAEVFDAHAREHALQRQVAKIQDDTKLTNTRMTWGAEGRSVELMPSGKGQTGISSHRPSGESETTRIGMGNARALKPSIALHANRLSALDASLPPETRRKRAVSLNMLRARILSEMASGASGVSPNIRLASMAEETLSPRHNHDGVAGTSSLVGADDEAHVFWCSACEGELVVL
ncbi:Myosin-9 [Rhizoctonia solani]|uniref:Myosin-9 n=1 Tax=Rhizoctonia solani TaxID=456999 RepID=A0A0K6GCS2_9AGAM|nr:Myosin-9 [Rhizoctonia solani]